MSFKEASKESADAATAMVFTGQNTSRLSHDAIVRNLPHTFVSVIALKADGSPEPAPTGTYTVFVRATPLAGFESIEEGTITGTQAAGSAAPDGTAKSVSFDGAPDAIKIVPAGETKAAKYKAVITQFAT